MNAVAAAVLGTVPAVDRSSDVKAIVAVSPGTLVEWCDFQIHAFTSIYCNSIYFVPTFIFGRLADKHGRKASTDALSLPDHAVKARRPALGLFMNTI